MTSIETLQVKISEVEKYFTIIKKYSTYSQKQLEDDLTLRGAVERYLYLLCQSAIDLGESIISFYSFRLPSTYSEIFEILHEQNIISLHLSQILAKMTGFRNILSHSYGKIDFMIVYQVLIKDSSTIFSFAKLIKNKLSK